MSEEEVTAQIEAYLEGTLEPEQETAFEVELGRNPHLREKVELHRRLEFTLGNQKEREVEANLRQIMESEPEAPSEPAGTGSTAGRPFPWKWVGIAATLALLISIGIFFYLRGTSPPTPQELYAVHYQPYDGSGEQRSETGIPDDLLSTAFEDYNSGDFTAAAAAFEEILQLQPGNVRAHFYLGICKLEAGAYLPARQEMEFVLAEGNNLYLDPAHWYAGLSCLRLEDSPCVREKMKALSGQPGKYQQAATQILDQVGN